MPKTLVYHPEARGEFKAAVAYGVAEWPERVADLVAEYESKVAFILKDWVERQPNEYGVLRINLGKRFPYHIIYRLKDDVAEIVAFSHHRQRDAYWLDRIS